MGKCDKKPNRGCRTRPLQPSRSGDGSWSATIGRAECDRIRMPGPVLCYEQLDALLEEIAESNHESEGVLRFDFSGVQEMGPNWTALVARLISFARGRQCACEAVNVHGQPLSVFRFLCNNAVVRRFLVFAPLVETDSPRKSA